MRVVKKLCEVGVSPEDIATVAARGFNSIWRWADGTLTSEELSVVLDEAVINGGLKFDAP